MSLEIFREECNCSKTYFFDTLRDFDKRIDWNGNSVKNISFTRGVVDDREHAPYLWSAYGTDERRLKAIKGEL